MGIEEQFENRNILDIISRNRKIEAVLNQASKDMAMKIAIFELKNPTKISQGSFYKINKALEKKVDTILNKLHTDIQGNIKDGIVDHWDMSNLKNNKLVGTWAEGIKLSKDAISPSFNQLNMAALDTFIARTAAGMNLSERVWNLTNGAKDQLELYLASGISTGRSAAEIAGDVKQYLNEPNRLFRRVRKEGKLVLSKAAKGYHPGAGIYRSSYKNALRLAKNEINMAYRMSDHIRRQQLPFVTGFEVHLSASHPRLDMCDDLVGKYPKGFLFMTWHVGCLCYTTSIMLNEKDSLKFMRTGEIPKSKYISKIPKRAANWIKTNASKIAGYKNLPYFIRDNFTAGYKDFILKENVTQIGVPKIKPIMKVPVIPRRGHLGPMRSMDKFSEQFMRDAKLQGKIYTRAQAKDICQSIRQFSGFDYASIRDFQTNPVGFAKSYPKAVKAIKAEAQRLDAFLKYSGKYTDDVIYRGIDLTSEQFAAFKKGQTIDMMGTSSFSSSIDEARVFGDYIFHVKSNSGISIRHISSAPHELEILMPKDIKFKILKISRKTKEIFLEEIMPKIPK